MYRLRLTGLRLIVLAGVVARSPGVLALQFEPGVGAGLEYTNNAALTPDHEDSDLIAIGYVGASLTEDSGPLTANAKTSLSYNHYTQNTFGDDHYFNLGATAGWDMIRQRLNWQLQDYFTQQSVNSLDANTPNNTQNTNAFTFGPNLYFPLSGRQQFTLSPVYRNFYYETSDTDNQQYGMQASWIYKLSPTLTTGLNGGVTHVKYDDEQKYPKYTSSTLQLALSGERVHSTYALNLGATSIDRSHVKNSTGMTGNLTWQRELTGHSSVRLYAASELTDTSTNLLNASVTPENGSFVNEQISGDTLRSSTIRVAYSRTTSRLQANLWWEWQKLDYQESPQDRKVRSVGVELNHPISRLLSSGLYGSYSRTEEPDTNRTDKPYTIGGNLTYRLSRMLRSVLDLRYRNESSTLDTAEYSEVSAFVSLVYGFGDINLPSRNNY